MVARIDPMLNFTTDDIDCVEWPDDWRVEVVDGDLVVTHAPGLNHQHAVGKVYRALDTWADQHGGRAYPGIGVIYDPLDDVIPDVVWISAERLLDHVDAAGHLRDVGPELVVEVVSPGRANTRRDREDKLALYGRHDALEYWIVDPQQRTVEQFVRADADADFTLRASLRGDDWLTSDLLDGFACCVRDFWA